MKNKRNFIICGILFFVAILFTILVKIVDVQPAGVVDSVIGFASINKAIFELTGVNLVCYNITQWLGVLPILFAVGYAVLGVYELVKRKSLKNVDREILVLGAFYVLVLLVYVIFEILVINYRPILINGQLEASYPSSHTLLALCFCGSSIIVNLRLKRNIYTKVMNISSVCIMVIMVVLRLVSGLHWLTDIIGGILISATLLMFFYTAICIFCKKLSNDENNNLTK